MVIENNPNYRGEYDYNSIYNKGEIVLYDLLYWIWTLDDQSFRIIPTVGSGWDIYDIDQKRFKFKLTDRKTVLANRTDHPRWNDSLDPTIYGTDTLNFSAYPAGHYQVGTLNGVGAFSLIKGIGTDLFLESSSNIASTQSDLIYEGGSVRLVRNCTEQDLLLSDGTIINNAHTDFDGNVYSATKIGTQIWLRENYKSTKCIKFYTFVDVINYADARHIIENGTDYNNISIGGVLVYNSNKYVITNKVRTGSYDYVETLPELPQTPITLTGVEYKGAYTEIQTNLSDYDWLNTVNPAYEIAHTPLDELANDYDMKSAYGLLYNTHATTKGFTIISDVYDFRVPDSTDFNVFLNYLTDNNPSGGSIAALKGYWQVNSPYVISQGDEIEINEPIGFDDFKVSIKRTQQHGVSVESSVGELEFYNGSIGDALTLIREKYNESLDAELFFEAYYKCADSSEFELIYKGAVDLSTYEEQIGDYCSCKCKVAEVGAKTKFNNRIETVIDLVDGGMKNLDGEDLTAVQLTKNISINAKGIDLTSKLERVGDSDTYITDVYNGDGLSFAFPFGVKIIDELPDSNDINEIEESLINKPLFSHLENFGYTDTFRIDLLLKMAYMSDVANLFDQFHVYTSTWNGSGVQTIVNTQYIPINNVSNVWKNYEVNLNIDITVPFGHYCTIQVVGTRTSGTAETVNVKALDGSYCKITKEKRTQDSFTDVIMPHEAFNRLSEVMAGITCKSDWFGRVDSQYNPTSSTGGGALKGLVKGLKLRNSIGTESNNSIISTSFKNLFSDLCAIDNLGFGFSTENGLFVRVEPWKWFYKDEVLLTINNPANKTRKFNPKAVYSRAAFGYDKYAEVDEINSIDTFQTKRNYSNGLKAVDNEYKSVSNLISDPYAIEFTRQKSFEQDTKDWKYDESTFVIALRKNSTDYSSDRGVIGNVISPTTLLNARISPCRNASKFIDILKQGKVPTDFVLTSSTGNIKAGFAPITESGYEYLNDPFNGDSKSEYIDIYDNIETLLKPEIIEFEYPLSKDNYDAIKANPYGQIVVDGEVCYIQEVKRSIIDGMGEFSLIPKI